MATTATEARFTALPDEETLAATTVALEEHGFSVEVVDDLDAARRAVLDRIPKGASVTTNTSVTLEETGIAEAINSGGAYESVRNKLLALDYATERREMRASRRTARLRSRKRPRGHAEGTLRRLGIRKPARPVRVGSRPGDLRRRSPEARPDGRGWKGANLRAQPAPRGRARVRCLRDEQPRREDPRDPPGGSGPHPYRDRARGRGLLRTGLVPEVADGRDHLRGGSGPTVVVFGGLRVSRAACRLS